MTKRRCSMGLALLVGLGLHQGCGALGRPPVGSGDATDAGGPLEGGSGLDLGTDPRSPGCLATTECGPDENCLDGACHPASADCAEILQRSPAATDGVYLLSTGGRIEPAYCDMRTQRVLCAATEGEHQGVTRDASAIPFLLKSRLELGSGVCRLWAVRHATEGQPLDQLDGLRTVPAGTLRSTCEVLGFKGERDMKRQCAYGAESDCGFPGQFRDAPVGRHVAKWGNSCDCNPNQNRPAYSLEKPVFFSHLPWNFDGTLSATCTVR